MIGHSVVPFSVTGNKAQRSKSWAQKFTKPGFTKSGKSAFHRDIVPVPGKIFTKSINLLNRHSLNRVPDCIRTGQDMKFNTHRNAPKVLYTFYFTKNVEAVSALCVKESRVCRLGIIFL